MFSVVVGGKRQPPWCRENRLDESDGLNLWIDTRDTHNIHRAGRFCHHFLFMPSGGGHRLNDATGAMLAINRAREAARPVPTPNARRAKPERPDGYLLEAFVPATASHGFRSSRASPARFHVLRWSIENWARGPSVPRPSFPTAKTRASGRRSN